MSVNKKNTEILAQKFRADHGLSATEAVSMKSVVRLCNILTVYLPMSDNAYGMSLKSPQNDMFILVNSKNARGRQHFTIAHEIFHLFYDEAPKPHLCCKDGKSPVERTADQFAAALLMPKEGVLKMLPADVAAGDPVSIPTALKIGQYFGTSHTATLIRLEQLGIIKKSEMQNLLRIPVIESAKKYGFDTSLYEGGNENLIIGDYGEKARKLLDDEIISEGHFDELQKRIADGEG